MKYDTAIRFYKTQVAIATELGIKQQSVSKWKKTGIVSKGSAYELQVKSGGKIKVDPKCYPT